MVDAVIGQFEDLEKLLHAGRRLKEMGYQITTLSPVSIHEEIESLLGEKKNPIRYLTFTGAITGFFFGILLTTITSVLYPLPRGGRPIIFVPPIIILSYETT
ncbi:MAG TPA: quinol:electron acceptor oxidoreductase subunit ActD, partial [Nitrospiria bacterium]|nr:quinol:electron acceptor oxidoreductase subunit ActD [Nitrospiria bacterium]